MSIWRITSLVRNLGHRAIVCCQDSLLNEVLFEIIDRCIRISHQSQAANQKNFSDILQRRAVRASMFARSLAACSLQSCMSLFSFSDSLFKVLPRQFCFPDQQPLADDFKGILCGCCWFSSRTVKYACVFSLLSFGIFSPSLCLTLLEQYSENDETFSISILMGNWSLPGDVSFSLFLSWMSRQRWQSFGFSFLPGSLIIFNASKKSLSTA